ncbi:Glyco_trans_2-like domain-containing protein [Pseudozyma hubeiensis]|nr:Glyco_trans_2-like domain-containing protein [Pseudozyma hubeiensis]
MTTSFSRSGLMTHATQAFHAISTTTAAASKRLSDSGSPADGLSAAYVHNQANARLQGTESPEQTTLQFHLAQQIAESMYDKARRINLAREGSGTDGIFLRAHDNVYAAYPMDAYRGVAMRSIKTLRCEAAIIVNSDIIDSALSTLRPGQTELILTPQQRVQVVKDLDSLWSCRKGQGAAFIQAEAIMVVWTEDGKDLMDAALSFQNSVLDYFESLRRGNYIESLIEYSSSKKSIYGHSKSNSVVSSAASSQTHLPSYLSRSDLGHGKIGHASSASHGSAWNEKLQDFSEKDAEAGMVPQLTSAKRPIYHLAPLLTGLSLGLNLLFSGIFMRSILVTCVTLNNYWYLFALLVIPFLMMLTQFFTDNIFGCIAQILMPYGQMKKNSLYYSGEKPVPLPIDVELPSITIQVPVYKESLETVIAPTIRNMKRAMKKYELQGGKANILVCEDGMQLISEEEQQARKEFYKTHECGWVSRPGHGHNGFVRAGRFKKASNMNFVLDFISDVQQLLDGGRATSYNEALEMTLQARDGIAQADGDVRLGEYIFLIDCDTRIPEDAFLDAASEMETCPEVGILQHCSGVMYVADHFFENMMGFFTDIVNWSISWLVACGATAPFVGHNAYIRTSALLQVSERDPKTGQLITWSESSVSEDFDMSLRLQLQGYVIRWATYANLGYLEGVSLTPSDELNRWQKYAFGCSEIIMHPLRLWPTKGPLTPLYKTFLSSSRCSLAQKVTVSSYMFSYYALAMSLPFAISMFITVGLFEPETKAYIIDSFKIWLSILVIFSAAGTVARLLCFLRSKQEGFLRALKRQVVYLLPLVVFFSGLPFHILLAILAHPIEYNMTWAATQKDVQETSILDEIKDILTRYWDCYLVMFSFLALMLLFGTNLLSQEFCIYGVNLYWPGSMSIAGHLLYPILLSPVFMRFSF